MVDPVAPDGQQRLPACADGDRVEHAFGGFRKDLPGLAESDMADNVDSDRLCGAFAGRSGSFPTTPTSSPSVMPAQ